MSYESGSHDSPVDVNDRLQRVGTKYIATLAAVADGDNTFFATDSKGRLIVVAHPKDPDASETKTIRGNSTSSTKSTLLTPASGKKVRVLSIQSSYDHATASSTEVYFGTGANVGTNSNKAIQEASLDLTDDPVFFISWPDGAGPIGAVDEVVSIRNPANVGNFRVIMVYREE